MITPDTAADIWNCHREIRTGEKLLADLAEEEAKDGEYKKDDAFEPRIQDAFGRPRQLQLGVPSGENCHRLFGVSADLAVSVIKVHIANQRARLAELNEKARLELNGTQAGANAR